MTYLAKIVDIGTGDQATIKTVSIIRDIIKNSVKNPRWRDIAIKLIRHVPQRNYKAESMILFRFVRDRVRFTKDTHGLETVQTPYVTLFKLRAGDCDDFVTALGTLLVSIGHQIRLVVIGSKSKRYDHIYLQDYLNGQWVALDPSDKRFKFGWEFKNPVRKSTWEV